MQINADALLLVSLDWHNYPCILLVTSSSLQIFENESHASVHSDRTKEGLSLYGISVSFNPVKSSNYFFHSGTLNSTKTSLGRSLMRTWLLRPSLSLIVINARLDAVACFVSPENLETSIVMHSHLNGIKNVPRMLGLLKTGRAKLSDWQGLVKVLYFKVACH
jgi:DNA mismatch repair protein MSH5